MVTDQYKSFGDFENECRGDTLSIEKEREALAVQFSCCLFG